MKDISKEVMRKANCDQNAIIGVSQRCIYTPRKDYNEKFRGGYDKGKSEN